MKTYKIGEIAKLLGISSETLRNYEKRGLIYPYKEDSNYRYFDIIQVNHLLNLQKYQQYGFHLNEIKDIMDDLTMEEVELALVQKEQELINESFYLNLKINSIHTTTMCMLQAQNAKHSCFLGTRPALYRLNYQKNLELIHDPMVHQEVANWRKYADLTFMSGSIPMNKEVISQKDFDFGFCMDQKTAEFLGIHENEYIHFYDQCPAVIFYYEAYPDNDLEEISKMLDDFAKKNQIRLLGESISRVLFARWGNKSEYMISHLVWIPYEPITSSK